MSASYNFSFDPQALTSFKEEIERCQRQEEVNIQVGYSLSQASNSLAKYKITLAPSLRACTIIPGTTHLHIDLFLAFDPKLLKFNMMRG